MLLAVMQTSPPVPRKAANNASQPSQQSQDKAGSNKTSSANPSPPNSPAEADVSTPERNSQAQNDKKEDAVKVAIRPITVSKDSGDYTLIVANLLLTLATLVIAIFAVKQAQAAKRSADNDERTARVTQRADVLLQDFEVHVDSTGKTVGRDTQFVLHIKNCGPSRASDVFFDFGMKVPGIKSQVAGRNYVTPPRVSIILGAGESQPYSFHRLCTMFDDPTIQKIADGRLGLSISGTIKYADVFGVSYTVTCGGQYSASLQTIVADETKIEEHHPKAR